MTSLPANLNGDRDLLVPIRFEGFEVSWVGASPYKDLFAFGSEDGRFLFADAEGRVRQPPQRATLSGEAINGLAFFQRWMCVSTRDEIVLWTLPIGTGDSSKGAKFAGGGHGVLVGHSGTFLAPLGRGGLLSCRPREGKEQIVNICKGVAEDAYFYRSISLQTEDHREIVACAARRGGIVAMELKDEDQRPKQSSLRFAGLDVVDLCPLGMASAPKAAALGKDGTIVLFRDVLHESQPLTVTYDFVRGTAYRILSTRGYLFVLTSEGMYVIAGLVERFLQGAPDNAVTPVLPLPMEAVDAYLGGEQWVWIVMPDGVLRLDVALLAQPAAAKRMQDEFTNRSPEKITVDWQKREVDQYSRAILAGA